MTQQKIKIATWNVNSVKARLPNVLQWLKNSNCDIALLQELKCVDDAFPRMEIEDLGYNVATYGQKTYNGVAILSKFPIDEVIRGIPNFTDEQARYIEGVISVDNGAIRVASVYVPNGQDETSEKFTYKLNFYDNLYRHLEDIKSYDEKVMIGGDFNCAPEDIDVHDPVAMKNVVCFHPEEQMRLRRITNSGYHDTYRRFYPNTQKFSWWDYRAGAWDNNKGMRIDHLLANSKLADSIIGCEIDMEPRGKEKASDHTPVVAEIKHATGH